MNTMLAYRLGAESRTIKVTVGAPDVSVKAMTAHGSKGLEFDYVFLPYATEEAWISKGRGTSFVLPKKHANHNDIADLRRLFYVALTRAKKDITIMPSLEESNGDVLTPLRFIGEIDEKYIEKISLSREDAKVIIKEKKNNIISMKILNLAKNVLFENGLSVTALNHFMECPNKFLYQSILKLPQAPSGSAEKGKTMHSAISRIWRNKSHTLEQIKIDLEEGIVEYLNESLLSIGEKNAVKAELLEKAPIVAKALLEHWNKAGTIFTEHWINSKYKDIPIHGQLDAIIDNGDEVEVFDYKTRESMSDNAIFPSINFL